MTSDASREDGFFIGYAPVPSALRRFIAAILFGLAVGVLCLGVLLAAGRRDPGSGEWRWDEGLVTLRGILELRPTPILHLFETPDGPQRGTLLLVEEGKHALSGIDPALEGQPVELGGTFLVRDGVRMVEVASYGDNRPHAYRSTATDGWATAIGELATVGLGHVRLSGEIADSKCHLGAMRPGNGKTHTGCAVLCLLGGIPPVLVVPPARPDASPAVYVLVDPNGRLIPEAEVDGLVGGMVTVEGEAERRGDLLFLRLALMGESGRVVPRPRS
jgi:hypothetical protein